MEIAVISGKGGTGKSSISAAFASILQGVVLADCDVDAANLHLIFNPLILDEKVYVSGYTAKVNSEQCIRCAICVPYCHFDALSMGNGQLIIDEISCDGCKLCSRVCPVNAISMIQNDKSRMYGGTFRYGYMVYGRLSPGEENTGKLVNMVREAAKTYAVANNIPYIIIDGPPGIGCPVISTLTGVDKAVIVTEATQSGLSDLKRAAEICQKLHIPTYIIINKFDINIDVCKEICNYCFNIKVDVIGKIPFERSFTEAQIACKSIIEYAPLDSVTIELEKMLKIILNKN